jgi:hypothetical protein
LFGENWYDILENEDLRDTNEIMKICGLEKLKFSSKLQFLHYPFIQIFGKRESHHVKLKLLLYLLIGGTIEATTLILAENCFGPFDFRVGLRCTV